MPKPPWKVVWPYKNIPSKRKVGKKVLHLVDEGLSIPSQVKGGQVIQKFSKKPKTQFKWLQEHKGDMLGTKVAPTKVGRYLEGKEQRSIVSPTFERLQPSMQKPTFSSQTETFAPTLRGKKVRVHPRTKLSSAQMKEVMRRVLKKQPKGGTPWEKIEGNPKLQGALFDREPPMETWYGRSRNIPGGPTVPGATGPNMQELVRGGKAPMTMEPLQDARLRYLKDPKTTVPVSGGGSFNRLSQTPPGTAGEIAPGVMYEKAKMGSILPPSVQRVLTDVLPQVKSGQRAAASTVATEAYEANMIWKEVVVGMRSTLRKMWEMRFRGSRYKRAHASAQDYFIAQYIKWKKSPVEFSRNFPSETQFFKQIAPEIGEKLGG